MRVDMHEFNRIADGLASWLRFEQLCGREPLFSESYLKQPLAQILAHQFPGRVLSEVSHPVLQRSGRGDRSRTDFVVTGAPGKPHELAIETKWLSTSTSLLTDMVRDVVRLQLLLPAHAKRGILLFAGKTRNVEEFFLRQTIENASQLRPKPHLFANAKRSGLYFFHPGTPDYIRKVLSIALEPLQVFSDIEIPCVIHLDCFGPFPRYSAKRFFTVLIWQVLSRSTKTFKICKYNSVTS